MSMFGSQLNASDKAVPSLLTDQVPLVARILIWIPNICLIFFAGLLILTSGLISYTLVTSMLLVDIKTGLTKETLPSLLETVDYTLIATTIFITGYSFLSVASKVPPTKYKYTESVATRKLISRNMKSLFNDFVEAMEKIDKLILSMITVTLGVKFVVFILEEKHGNIGAGVLYLGFGIGIVIFNIAIYLYLTRRAVDKT